MLELAPTTGRPYNADMPDGNMRKLMFGAHGEGAVTYLILEQQCEVRVLLVQGIS